MLQRLINPYTGLSKEIWYLAIITLVNRAGAMVLPFLSLYLTKDLNFDLSHVGWILTAYGAGSLLGTFLGGKLTDKFGFQKVMVTSLFFTGLFFIGLQFFKTYTSILLGFFLLSLIADIYRPAIWVAMDAYSKKENKTRSVTLIRLAINLGFSAGPAIGGFIIAYLSYNGLFWVDGITCIIAAVMQWYLLKPKKQSAPINDDEQKPVLTSPYRDTYFILFVISIMLMGITFMQLFTTMPVYFNKVVGFSEERIGLLLALNGLIIALLEMPIISYFEKKKQSALKLTLYGFVLFVMAYIALFISDYAWIPLVAVLFITFGEIISFPFSNTFALNRASKGKMGAFMALYTMSFSAAHLIGPNLGMQISDHWGFKYMWLLMIGIIFISSMIMYYVYVKTKDVY